MTAASRLLPARIEADYPISQRLVDAYADVSGDRNPLHIDPAYAAGTRFGRTIAHGLMSLGFVSATLEARLGGLGRGEMECAFTAPLYPGDSLHVALMLEPETAQGPAPTYSCHCTVGERIVLKAKVVIHARDGS